MKSNDPHVNVLKQVRKACGAIRQAQRERDVQKVYYLSWCLVDMVERGNQSWSQYTPMVQEEFEIDEEHAA